MLFLLYADVISVNIVLVMLFLYHCKHTKMIAFAGNYAILIYHKKEKIKLKLNTECTLK